MEGMFLMYTALVLLHILGAVAMGIYAVIPFVVNKLKLVSASGQEGLLLGVHSANRIAQYALIAQFLTGGYMIGKGSYSMLWIILTMVVFLAIAALGGIMGKQIKVALQSAKAGQSNTAAIDKTQMFATLVFILFIIMVILMVYRNI